MKVAILGGTFNPPHIGHLALAESVCKTYHYDTIFFIPAFLPPHKAIAKGATTSDRITMLKKSLRHNKKFKIELCEIQRGGLSYTIDTVNFLEKKYSSTNTKKKQNSASTLEGKIGVILGDDLVEGFDSWKNARELSEKTDLILACRNNQDVSKIDFAYTHIKLNNAYLPISSSVIREKIFQKKAFRYLVPESVYEYIIKRNLYEN